MFVKSLKMDQPVLRSLLDGGQEVIGKPISRTEGPLKVKGQAQYAAEEWLPNLAHGFLVQASKGAGRIRTFDTAVAMKMPGVLDIVTLLDGFVRDPHRDTPTRRSPEIRYYGEAIAVVVAETFEEARAGAKALLAHNASTRAAYDFAENLTKSDRPPDGITPAFTEAGNLEHGMRLSDVTVDHVWTTPAQSSSAMEPHAAVAHWDAGRLTIRCAHQALAAASKQLATALGISPDSIRILAPYVGGGFGGKLDIFAEAVAAAVTARRLGRPVKVVMTRQQVFDATVCRPETYQRLRLGARKNGKIIAIGHETITSNMVDEDWFEMSGVATNFLYAGAHRRVSHRLVRLNRLRSASMRGPGEGSGMFALEGAMDELAEKLGLDPIELRRINEPALDPESGKPFSSRQLIACLDQGAELFGWEKRNRVPGKLRNGEWLVGYGVAAAARTNKLRASQARVSLVPLGSIVSAIIETDMTDIGTGTYTILAQIAGEMLGLTMSAIEVRLGDTNFPTAAGSGGSWGAGSAGSSVYLACSALRDNIAATMNVTATDVTFKDGYAITANRRQALVEVIGSGLSAEGKIEPGATSDTASQASFGAHFCEVHVNAYTGEKRIARWLSVIAAGRILNEKTARSQCIGGITFGIGAALSEELLHDRRTGSVVNHDLAGYEVPVHSDVPHLEVLFLAERDPFANPMQSKGLGELGVSGSGAAIANAVYNATGVRIRNLPIRVDRLLQHLPTI